jgi:hypothetical protein
MKKILLLILMFPVFAGAQVSDSDKVDSVKTMVDTVKTVSEEGMITESEIRSEVKETIDNSIIDIRKENTTIQAYELSREINESENLIYTDVGDTVDGGILIDVSDIDALQTRVDEKLDQIESSLENVSGVDVDMSKGKENVRSVITKYRSEIEINKSVIEDRGGDLLDEDTDGDGVSDYDEVYIYDTDPENTHTSGGNLSDGEKILRGINPADVNESQISYSDPRSDKDSYISDVYTVDRVELIDYNGQKRVKLQGKALPNSYTTIYVYSTPAIVTIKTDGRGEWSYTLDKELENGDHSVYVATVNNSGRLVARSSAIPFTKTAEAAAIGTFGIGETAISQNSFIQENFILIILVILLAAIVITLMLTGRKKEEVELVSSEEENNSTPQV